MNVAEPYLSPTDQNGTGDELSRKCTRRVVLLLETTIVLCAIKHLIWGCAYLWSGWSMSMHYPENPLVPSALEEQWRFFAQSDFSRGKSAVVFGLFLASIGALVWRYRLKLLRAPSGADGQVTSATKFLRRYAVGGIVAAFLGFLASPDVYGFSAVSFVRPEQLSEFFALIGFGASVIGLAIGWEARISIVESFLSYAVAIIGTLLSCGLLVWMFLPFVHWLLRRLVAPV